MPSLEEQSRKLPTAKSAKREAPCNKCGGTVTYRGFTSIACVTVACENYDGESGRPTLPDFSSLDFGMEDFGAWGMFTKGTREWARCKKRLGPPGLYTYVIEIYRRLNGGWDYSVATVDADAPWADSYDEPMKNNPLLFWDTEGWLLATTRLEILRAQDRQSSQHSP